jgi:hypothetical protein
MLILKMFILNLLKLKMFKLKIYVYECWKNVFEYILSMQEKTFLFGGVSLQKDGLKKCSY